jgi:hypothetical protein
LEQEMGRKNIKTIKKGVDILGEKRIFVASGEKWRVWQN